MKGIIGIICTLALTGSVLADEAIEIVVRQLSVSELPEGLPKGTGKIVEAVRWVDRAGESVLIIDEITIGAVLEPGYVSKLNATQYRRDGDKYSEVWRIRDFNYADAAVEYLEGTLKIFDLDQDGLAESAFFYSIFNDDKELTKYMMHSKGKKLVIRGEWNVEAGKEPALLTESVDKEFDSFPKNFRDYALKEWNDRLERHN